MSVKCSVYIAASVDGFIARPDGDIDWLLRPEYEASELNGLRYEDFISTVDALVMGRNSFEKALSFNEWPYEGIPVVVLTGRDISIPAALTGKVGVASGEPGEVVSRLESEGKRHLYIDGGDTIQRFLRARLVGEITITRIPILLGEGISLFGSLGIEVGLRLLEATTSDNGFVQVRYAVEYGA